MRNLQKYDAQALSGSDKETIEEIVAKKCLIYCSMR